MPLLTPLDENENFCDSSMEKLVNYVVDNGVDGIFTMGTSGEFFRFGDAMRAEIIAATVRFTNKRVPVYAGVSDSGTKRVISHIHAAQKSGVDALVCTMPYYAPNTSHKAVTQFFCDVLSECDVPLILYTIPQAIGSAIPLETLDEIAEHPKIVAIKDSGQDILYTRQLIERYMKPGLLNVLIGNEDNLLQGMLAGAAGSVPSLANVFPRLLCQLHQNAVEKNKERLKESCRLVDEFNAINRFTKEWMAPNIWRKVALNMMGIMSEKMAAPSLPVPPEAREQICHAVEKYYVLFPKQKSAS